MKIVRMNIQQLLSIYKREQRFYMRSVCVINDKYDKHNMINHYFEMICMFS